MSEPRLTRSQNLVVFALTAIVLLLGLSWWTHHRAPPPGEVADDATCEARCLARDPLCESFAQAQGGYPGLEYDSSERRARCRGLCVVIRATAHDAPAACLK